MNRYSSTSAKQSYDTLTPELKQWVRTVAHSFRAPEQEFIESCCRKYGSVEKGKIAYEAQQEGIRKIHEEIREMQKFNPPPEPIKLGAKPSAHEKVIITPINDNIAIRIWGDNTKSLHIFSFDFINKAGKHIRAPPGVKIYTVAGGILPVTEVYPIEKCLAMSDTNGSLRNSVDKSVPFDPDWETYLIPEGARLRITSPNSPDLFLNIPSRQPEGRVLQIQSYW